MAVEVSGEKKVKLTVENVTPRFGDITALDDVSFDVRDGEIRANDVMVQNA